MIIEVVSRRHPVTGFVRKTATLICDECHVQFDVEHCVKERISRKNHFCSQQCVRRSLLVDAKKRATCLERYGVEVSSQSDCAKSTYTQTCQAKWGVNSVFAASDFHKKRQAKIEQKYGVSHFSKLPAVQDKIARSTNKATVERHWKTNDELLCVGSWELAVVRWLNANQIDYEWQPGPFAMPDGRTYRPDILITSGFFMNTYVEVKGYMRADAKAKWEWFHAEHQNSQLWTKKELQNLEILPKK